MSKTGSDILLQVDEKELSSSFNQKTKEFRLQVIDAKTIFSDWYLDGTPQLRTDEQKAASADYAYAVDHLGGNRGLQRINNRFSNESISSQEFPDAKEAYQSFSEAARAGHGLAINNLALCTELGLGVEVNLRMAALYYNILALEMPNYYLGFYNTGACYFNGYGVPKNVNVAYNFLVKAIQIDENQAAPWYGLGLAYHSIGKIPDARLAFQKAANRGSTQGKYAFAIISYQHFTLANQAFNYLTDAAMEGYAPAEFTYGATLLNFNPYSQEGKSHLIRSALKKFPPALAMINISNIPMTLFCASGKYPKKSRTASARDVKSDALLPPSAAPIPRKPAGPRIS